SAICQNLDRKLSLIAVGFTPEGLQFSMCLLDRWDYMMAVGGFECVCVCVCACVCVHVCECMCVCLEGGGYQRYFSFTNPHFIPVITLTINISTMSVVIMMIATIHNHINSSH